MLRGWILRIGYIDGLLHVQTAVRRSQGLIGDNHCSLYLKDEAGNAVQCDFNAYFTEYSEAGDDSARIDYCEIVFDIPQSEIGRYQLYGNVYTSGLYTEGSWRVTFPLTQTKP